MGMGGRNHWNTHFPKYHFKGEFNKSINKGSRAKQMIKVDKVTAEAAILGGAILGGGGGGWLEEGKRLAEFALAHGFAGIFPLEALSPDELLLTVSAVGAPSARQAKLSPEDYARCVEYFLQKSKTKIHGLISSEVGAMAVVNGWVQSALLGLPVIDAAANGRAHPLGLMGSMGLHRKKNFLSQQAAVGRDISGYRHERFLEGSIEETSKAVRQFAVEMGGMVAVARHPLPAAHVQKKGAPSAISLAIKIGQVYLKKNVSSPAQLMAAILAQLGGGFLDQARVEKYHLEPSGGFDVGEVQARSQEARYELLFWNEYMTLERNGQRLATFPDLIMTFEAETGRPLISAAVKKGQEIFLLASPAHNLILGAGVKDKALLRRIEGIIGKAIINV